MFKQFLGKEQAMAIPGFDAWLTTPPDDGEDCAPGFLDMVETELAKARAKHTTPIHNAHEAYGVIAEEFAEFFDEVRAQKHDKDKMLKELIQTAAMCYRAVEDLGLLNEE